MSCCPQGSQLIQALQNLARHQSLLVENNQALLLQTSRIASLLQDITKKPPEVGQLDVPSVFKQTRAWSFSDDGMSSEPVNKLIFIKELPNIVR